MDEHTVYGHEIIERNVTDFGHETAHIPAPKEWSGGTVKVILTQRPTPNQPVANPLFHHHLTYAFLNDITLTSEEKNVLKTITDDYEIRTLQTLENTLKDRQQNPEEYSQEDAQKVENTATSLLDKFKDLYQTH